MSVCAASLVTAAPSLRAGRSLRGSVRSAALPRATPRRSVRTVAAVPDNRGGPAAPVRAALAHADKQVLGLGVLVAYTLLQTDPAHAADLLSGELDASQLEPQSLWDLAEGEDFWSNMGRYAKYAVTVVFGTGYVIVKPLFQYLKKPQTGIPLVIGVALLIAGIRWVLKAMLGMNEEVADALVY